MMYNRYIPESNGIYKKHCVVIPDSPPSPDVNKGSKEESPCLSSCASQHHLQSGWDLGDLLLLCIVILLLLDSEDGDILPILIAAAAFLFLQ